MGELKTRVTVDGVNGYIDGYVTDSNGVVMAIVVREDGYIFPYSLNEIRAIQEKEIL